MTVRNLAAITASEPQEMRLQFATASKRPRDGETAVCAFKRALPSMPSDVIQYDLPAPCEVLEAMKERSGSLAVLASHTREEILDLLRRELRFDGLPHLASLSNAILEFPLTCLSAHEDAYWLTFEGPGRPIHFPGRNEIPHAFYEAYPVVNVKGLEEFLRYFGGMVHGYLDAPAGRFYLPSKPFLVLADDTNYFWGTTGDWEGALVLYGGPSGDQIVVDRNGSPGKWTHDGLTPDDSFTKLTYSFTELIEHFAAYLRLPCEDPGIRDSPFYY